MTPENSAYYHAAYIAASLVYGLYIVSLVVRFRRVRERQRRRDSRQPLPDPSRSEA